MTTIAYRDGVLAADTLATKDGMRTGQVSKIRRLPSGELAATLGDAGCAIKLRQWVEAGRAGDQPNLEGGAVIIISRDGEVEVLENGGSCSEGVAPFYAWGCGAPLAIGAMAHGATSEQAVRIAIEYDTLTGGAVTTLAIKPTPEPQP